MSVPIRDATPSDHIAIARVVRAAFVDDDLRTLVEQIRAAGARPELVAVDADVVGHVMLSGVALGDTEVLILSPLSVDPVWQGRGIGGALVRACLERAEAAGEPLVLVEGDPRYYGRFGFEPASPHGIIPPPGVPEFAFQLYALRPSLPAGQVRYPAHFDPFVGP